MQTKQTTTKMVPRALARWATKTINIEMLHSAFCYVSINLDFIDWYLATTHTAEMCWTFLAQRNRCCWGPVRFFYYYLSLFAVKFFVSTFCETVIGSERREILCVYFIFISKSHLLTHASAFFSQLSNSGVCRSNGNRVCSETRWPNQTHSQTHTVRHSSFHCSVLYACTIITACR